MRGGRWRMLVWRWGEVSLEKAYVTLLNSSWYFRSDDIINTENSVENEVFSFNVKYTKVILSGDISIVREITICAYNSSKSIVSHLLDTSKHFLFNGFIDFLNGIVSLASPLSTAVQNHFRGTLDKDSSERIA
jgi:hypothetical protein